MPSLGPAEILVILVVALLVFGPDKMPEIARQVGKGVREFRRVQQHLRSELRDVVSDFDAPSAGTADADPVPMLPAKTPEEMAAPPANGSETRDPNAGDPHTGDAHTGDAGRPDSDTPPEAA